MYDYVKINPINQGILVKRGGGENMAELDAFYNYCSLSLTFYHGVSCLSADDPMSMFVIIRQGSCAERTSE